MFKKLSPKSDSNQELTATVRFLDDSDPLHIKFQKNQTGEWLIDKVCDELNLTVEKDYFGLRFVDAERQRHWLDPLKTVYRQLKHVSQMVVCFRVKFYPDDPMKLQEEVTRYSLFLQLRRDLHHGRLLCSSTDANNLAAHIIQSEVGDYHEEDCQPGYVAKFKMLPRQTSNDEEKIMDIHKTLSGLVPAEAEQRFLKKACALDTYGVDPHQVQDSKNVSMYLGVTHLGVVTFHSNKRNNLYKWENISKLAFDSKMFIIHLDEEEKKLHVGYRCPTPAACKHLWKCAVEQQAFFTLDKSTEAKKVFSGGGLFRRSSKYRFSGRCQNEVFNYSTTHKRDSIDFTRSPSSTLQRRFSQKRPERPHVDIKKEGEYTAEDIPTVIVTESIVTNDDIMNHQDASADDVIAATEEIPSETQPSPPGDGDTNEDASNSGTDAEDTAANVVGNHVSPDTVDGLGDGQDIEEPTTVMSVESNTTNDLKAAAPGPSGDVAPESNHKEKKTEATPTSPQKAAVRQASPIIPILLFMFLLVIVAVVILDDRFDIPFLQDVRQSEVLSNMRYQYYNPMRDYVGNKVQALKGS